MGEHCDDHVATELEILESLLQAGTVILSHEGVEKYEVDCDENLDSRDVRVQIDASLADVETFEKARQWALCQLLRFILYLL